MRQFLQLLFISGIAFQPGDDVTVWTESGTGHLKVDALSLDLLNSQRVLVTADPHQALELHFEQSGLSDVVWPVTLDSNGRLVQDLAGRNGPFVERGRLIAVSGWIKHGYEHRVIARLSWNEGTDARVYLPMLLIKR